MPTQTGQTVCLSMIVKDEATVIDRCLRSVLPFVDRYAIVDTGSTDNTVEKCCNVLAPTLDGKIECIPAHRRSWLDKLRHRNFFDFAAARNRALDLARAQGCDYVLLIDADEAIEAPNGTNIPALTESRYVATFRMMEDGRKWHRSFLVRASDPWEYRHPIHEALWAPEELGCGVLAGIEVASYSDGCRNQDKVGKFQRDAWALRDAIRKDPEEPRYWFYLGQSLAGAGHYLQAIDAYRKRVEMRCGWDEEWWFAKYQIAVLQGYLGYSWLSQREAHLAAWDDRPCRAEPLWAAGVLSRDNGDPAVAELLLRHALKLPLPADSFLVDPAIYEWRVADDLAAALALNGKKDECLDLLRQMLDCPALPEAERKRVADNLAVAEAEP